MRSIFLFLLFPSLFFAQSKNEIINPKGNWYFGAEIGSNKISSFSMGESNTSFQGGILAEYYFAKHWSVLGRIKYFETGVSFSDINYVDTIGLILPVDYSITKPYSNLYFKGQVVSIPIDLKFEINVYNELHFFSTLGFAYNREIKSEYILPNYESPYDISMFNKSYINFNLGIGLSYFVNSSANIFINTELSKFGGLKGTNNKSFFSVTYYEPENNFINIGIKYNFKK